MQNFKFTIYFGVIIFLLLAGRNLYAQEWIDMADEKNPNLYEIEKKFNEYWAGKEVTRSSGHKQFLRWKAFWAPRVYPTGNLPSPMRLYDGMQIHNVNKERDSDRGSNWTPMGPYSWNSTSYNPGLGRVNSIVVDPNNSNIIFAGVPSGGLWKSTNGGDNWITTTDDLTALGVSSIAIDPTNSNVIYIATGDGDGGQTYSLGVLKSTDGGNTFNVTGLNWTVTQFRRSSKILINPNNTSTVIVATSNGIYRSTDAGANWTQTLSGGYYDLEFKPGDPSVVYTARNRSSNAQFYRSTDGGLNFSPVATGLPGSALVTRFAIGVSPANSEYVYILAGSSSGNGFYGFYKSTNSGVSFTETTNSPNILGYSMDGSSTGGQSSYDLAIAVSPTDEDIVYTGGINVWKTTNGGTSFTISTHWVWPPTTAKYSHADIHFLEFYGSSLFCGSDGGFFIATDNGNTWTNKTSGMQITQFYKIGGTESDPYLLYGGTQDNGSNRFNSGNFTHVYGADGGECAIDYTNSDIVYVETQRGGMRRSTNGGLNFVGITASISETGAFVTPFEMDPVNPSVLYAGFDNVWKTTNQGAFWNKISTFSIGKIATVSIAPSNTDYIYIASSSTAYRTTNGGTNWTDITAGLPSNSITYIDVSNTDPEKIWLTQSGYTSGQKVFKSTNGGDGWASYSGSLPNLPANCIVYRNGSPDGVYVGTDVGVYYRDNTMSDWIAFSTGLPNVRIRELEINYSVQKLRAATFGRGLWESALDSTVGVDPVSSNIPDRFSLYQNYPNPFNPNTTIRYDIVNKANVKLVIYNTLGKEVRTLVSGVQATGEKSVVWDGKDNNGQQVSSGIYIYEITAGDLRESKKMVLMK